MESLLQTLGLLNSAICFFHNIIIYLAMAKFHAISKMLEKNNHHLEL